MYEDKTILIDISKWNPNINFRSLADGGVTAFVAKATQGNTYISSLFKEQINNGNLFMPGGAYHWCDPTHNDTKQAENLLKTIEKEPVCFIALDVEQYWESWAEFTQHNITHYISPERISENAWRIWQWLKARTALPMMLYTRTTFIESWSKPMLTWLPDFTGVVWLAQYPYGPAKVECTWEEWRKTWFPKSMPRLPKGYNQPVMWQCSGDKFILPGTGNNKIDINLWPGTAESFKTWANYGYTPPPPTEESPKLPHSLVLAYTLKLHDSPNISSGTVNGSLNKTARPLAYEVAREDSNNIYARIGENIWLAVKSKGVKLAQWS